MAVKFDDLTVLWDGLYAGDLVSRFEGEEWTLWPSTLTAEFTASDLRQIADKLDELNSANCGRQEPRTPLEVRDE